MHCCGQSAVSAFWQTFSLITARRSTPVTAFSCRFVADCKQTGMKDPYSRLSRSSNKVSFFYYSEDVTFRTDFLIVFFLTVVDTALHYLIAAVMFHGSFILIVTERITKCRKMH